MDYRQTTITQSPSSLSKPRYIGRRTASRLLTDCSAAAAAALLLLLEAEKVATPAGPGAFPYPEPKGVPPSAEGALNRLTLRATWPRVLAAAAWNGGPGNECFSPLSSGSD